MTLPEGLETVTVTGRFLDADGDSCRGTITFNPAPCVITFRDQGVFVLGPETVNLNGQGEFTATLVASDATGADPQNFTYHVSEHTSCADCRREYDIVLPSGTGTIDLADLAPADPTTGDYLPVVGPPGPPGPAGISTDAGNTAVPGTDGLIYVPDPLTSGPLYADPAQDPAVMFVNADTGNNGNLQSFAIDSVNGHVYAVQMMAGGMQFADEPAPLTYDERNLAGDLCFTRLTMTGEALDRMYVRGIGHGVQIGIDNQPDGTPLIWSGVDKDENTNSTGVGYFPWAPSDTVPLDNADIAHRYQPTGQPEFRSYCTVDPTTRTLITCHHAPPEWTFTAYPLDEAYQDVWNPVAQFTVPINVTLQGFAGAGGYLYVWTGNSIIAAPGNNAVMQRYSTTGELLQASKTDVLLGQVDKREPEGTAVWLPNPEQPDQWALAAGFGTTLDGRYTVTLVNWDAVGHLDDAPMPGLDAVCQVGAITTTEIGVGAPSESTRAVNGTLTVYCQAADDVSVPAVETGDVSFYTHRNGNTVAYGYLLAHNSLAVGSTRVEDFGGGEGVLAVAEARTEPTGTPAAGAVAYARDGALYVRQADGTTIGLTLSTDPGNRLTIGSDGGLYVGPDTTG
jgi:hypothetical protein